MKITAVEELAIRQRRRYKNYKNYESDWRRLLRLLEEVVELIGSLLGIHKDTVSHELKQIASICMNWMEKRAKI